MFRLSEVENVGACGIHFKIIARTLIPFDCISFTFFFYSSKLQIFEFKGSNLIISFILAINIFPHLSVHLNISFAITFVNFYFLFLPEIY